MTFPRRWQCSRDGARVKPAQVRRLRRSTRLDRALTAPAWFLQPSGDCLSVIATPPVHATIAPQESVATILLRRAVETQVQPIKGSELSALVTEPRPNKAHAERTRECRSRTPQSDSEQAQVPTFAPDEIGARLEPLLLRCKLRPSPLAEQTALPLKLRCNQGYFVPPAGFGVIKSIVRTLEKLSDCHPRHNIRNSEARRN